VIPITEHNVGRLLIVYGALWLGDTASKPYMGDLPEGFSLAYTFTAVAVWLITLHVCEHEGSNDGETQDYYD
jgi:hypothetical protein